MPDEFDESVTEAINSRSSEIVFEKVSPLKQVGTGGSAIQFWRGCRRLRCLKSNFNQKLWLWCLLAWIVPICPHAYILMIGWRLPHVWRVPAHQPPWTVCHVCTRYARHKHNFLNIKPTYKWTFLWARWRASIALPKSLFLTAPLKAVNMYGISSPMWMGVYLSRICLNMFTEQNRAKILRLLLSYKKSVGTKGANNYLRQLQLLCINLMPVSAFGGNAKKYRFWLLTPFPLRRLHEMHEMSCERTVKCLKENEVFLDCPLYKLLYLLSSRPGVNCPTQSNFVMWLLMAMYLGTWRT